MKIFISALEAGFEKIYFPFFEKGGRPTNVLYSYYALRKEKESTLEKMFSVATESYLIDSGAHSFQKGVKVDWIEYTKQYAKFIKKYDSPRVEGYFEMDIDPAGYSMDTVLEMREILEKVSDKIIPVWHKNRGRADFVKMCETYSGRLIAITGFKNQDIKDEDYRVFLKIAEQYNCKVHCLGMTRFSVMKENNFYSVDSSTWKGSGIYGQIHRWDALTKSIKSKKTRTRHDSNALTVYSLREWLKAQRYWRGI